MPSSFFQSNLLLDTMSPVQPNFSPTLSKYVFTLSMTIFAIPGPPRLALWWSDRWVVVVGECIGSGCSSLMLGRVFSPAFKDTKRAKGISHTVVFVSKMCFTDVWHEDEGYVPHNPKNELISLNLGTGAPMYGSDPEESCRSPQAPPVFSICSRRASWGPEKWRNHRKWFIPTRTDMPPSLRQLWALMYFCCQQGCAEGLSRLTAACDEHRVGELHDWESAEVEHVDTMRRRGEDCEEEWEPIED